MLFTAVLFTATAQTTIVNKLEIKTVATDTTATDVLVRGADRKVKKVPISFLQSIPQLKTVDGQSLFGNGDIPFPTSITPNIDQVLSNGDYTIGKSISFNSTDNSTTAYIGFYGFNYLINNRVFGLYNGAIRASNNQTGDMIVINEDKISFANINTSATGIKARHTIGSGTIYFPNVFSDTRTLAISVNGNYADDNGNITVNSIASSGSYSPTFEVISNLSNVTGGATPSYYTRVGNVVTVYIRFFNNQSAANTATAFRASLPFPRANTTQINYVGTGTVGYGGVESDIPCRVFFEPGQTSCRISYYTKGNFGTQFGVVSLQYSVDE